MSFVSEMQALAGELYGLGTELGVTEHAVSVAVPGSLTQDADTGLVKREDEATVTFWTAVADPVSLERAAKSGGALAEGDIILKMIPRSPTNDALVVRPDVIWTVTGPGITGSGSFRLRSAQAELVEWVVTLTRGGD
jgi:hypothetical protein